MDQKIGFKDRLKYQLDNLFSRGTGAMIAALGILSLVIILISSFVLTITKFTQEEGTPLSFIEAFWESMMRTFDAGTMGGDTGWGYRLVMLFVTVGGIFVISTLIGILTSGVEGKLEELRKGRSRVLESNHTVILGWSEAIFTIISELVVANENRTRPSIVILGDRDKVEMEDAIRGKVEDTKNTKIVCRTGSPIDLADLNLVNLNDARSIIVLSPEDDDPDAEVIKAVLAITNYPQRRSEPYHIVAEIRDKKNIEVAKIVGKDEVEWLQVSDMVARIIAQTCRQSGLSVVYSELMDFGGDEIYFYQNPALVGKTFGESLLSFEKNTVMGLCKKDGVPGLNPPMETVLQTGDELVLLAEDDDKILLNINQASQIQSDKIVDDNMPVTPPEQTVILGWNWRTPEIIGELDNYVPKGSEVFVVAEDKEARKALDDARKHLKNQKIVYQEGDPTDRSTLDSLHLENFEHVILLTSDELDVQKSDAHTLVSLLHLRDISNKHHAKFSIVSEMRDVRNRTLADVTRADDFVVSDKLVSLLLAQVSENKRLNAVFADIFDPEGSEIYLKPVSQYIVPGTKVNFYTIVEAARRRNETAIGYRIQAYAQDSGRSYGVLLNPSKSEEISFSENDRIVVISEG